MCEKKRRLSGVIYMEVGFGLDVVPGKFAFSRVVGVILHNTLLMDFGHVYLFSLRQFLFYISFSSTRGFFNSDYNKSNLITLIKTFIY